MCCVVSKTTVCSMSSKRLLLRICGFSSSLTIMTCRSASSPWWIYLIISSRTFCEFSVPFSHCCFRSNNPEKILCVFDSTDECGRFPIIDIRRQFRRFGRRFLQTFLHPSLHLLLHVRFKILQWSHLTNTYLPLFFAESSRRQNHMLYVLHTIMSMTHVLDLVSRPVGGSRVRHRVSMIAVRLQLPVTFPLSPPPKTRVPRLSHRETALDASPRAQRIRRFHSPGFRE